MGRSSELDGLTTLPELLMQSIQKNGDREALRQYDRATGKWESWTYKELGEHVLAWRRAFAAMGLKPGERIAILMPNGRDHVCADQAALANGLIPVPLHAIDTPGASAFITIDSQAATLVTNKLTRWQQIRATGVPLPDLKNIIITDPGETENKSEGRFHIRSLESILLEGASWTEDLPAGPLEDDLAGIIYTSGTTGRPKGVMLTHRNIVSNVKATLECVSPKVGDTFLSFLPLSHTFERTAGYYLALATGCIIAYNRSVLLLAEDLKTIKPTVIISVPRVYERIYARVQDKLRKSRPIAKKLFDWAVEVGWRDFCRKNHLPVEKSGRSWLDGIVRATLLHKMANTLLSQFGGRLRIAISGGAALNHKVARTFCGLGLPIIQGYGMTEASPIIAGNCVEFNQPDTVGKPFCNVEIRLGEGNEIQVRAPSIMKGYWHRPEDTAAAFTKDGWLKTGDVGEFNADGMLKIKGRIKEIIVTSTGEKIPVNLEFLCADEKNEIAGVLRTLIKKGGFSENHFQNQTLFFLNSKDSLPGTREISRKRCSNVIKNIVQQDYKRERERQNMFHVTKGDPGEVSMAIISLDSFRTLLEELSYDMVDECLTDEMVKPVIQRKLKELWE